MLLNVLYLKSYQMFALAVTVYEKIKFYIFYLEKVGHGHEEKTTGLMPFDHKCLNAN